MKPTFSKLAKRFNHPAQAGQTIVIMALGFIALLGFVGIVTDVSLMFLNYSNLTRAVDSASVAAAGQVRRLIPNADELALCDGSSPEATPRGTGESCRVADSYAFARSYANVGVAARQFLEFYGVNPKAVVVDMCPTVSMYEVDADGNRIRVPVPGLEADFAELCEDGNDQRKLIRVTAQAVSPTVFLRLLGWSDITLQASAISETAVLDVVLIVDVSESMANQTTYETWARQGYDRIYLPPRITSETAPNFGYPDPIFGFYEAWYNLSLAGQAEVNSRLTTANPTSPYYVRELSYPYPIIYDGPARPPVRAECQVRFWPNSVNFDVPQDVRNLYAAAGAPYVPVNGKWAGFVPNYDYFGCCNDPNGDGDFDDVLCQPFRDMRDAIEIFMQRIDFLRGDRVAYVAFDREAYLVNYINVSGNLTHMIENESDALTILRRDIGVRAEPSYYQPQTTTVDINGVPTQVMHVPWLRNPDGTVRRSDRLSPAHDWTVMNNCPFHDAALGFPYSWQSNPQSEFFFPPYGNFEERPAANPNLLFPIMYPRGGAWDNLRTNYPTFFNANYSYDLWASCRNSNVGAALREGSNALLDQRTTRTDGAVWVMVLLGDGAAAGSDPTLDGGAPTSPERLDYPYSTRQRVQYGGLGLCPPGVTSGTPATTFSELVSGEPRNRVDNAPSFPFCSDPWPETRHFCPLTVTPEGAVITDLGAAADCRTRYDVDDYSRDWADWIGLAELPSRPGIRRSTAQLPTIFTIGFGLNFSWGTETCKEGFIQSNPANPADTDIGDCLGEELLRYIADVGDNFRVDTDYQQDWLHNPLVLGSVPDNEWGERGPCEDPNINPVTAILGGNYNSIIAPLRAGESCGNYYNAPTADQLGDVFDDIASRMFTRLTQ
jgi:hypothetical protein